MYVKFGGILIKMLLIEKKTGTKTWSFCFKNDDIDISLIVLYNKHKSIGLG